MGIQTLREVLEDATNKGTLNANDTFAYTKFLVEWMTAKGSAELKKQIKEEKQSLREIYKRVLYKKF